MTVTSVNHVNLLVDDVEAAVEFYESVVGLERVPSIDTDVAMVWFRLGDAQLHLSERGADGSSPRHLAVTVDDFADLYDRLVERDALDDTFGAPLYVFPDGAVQVYFRDPSGNLLEADCPDVTTLPDEIRERARMREATADDATIFPE